LEGGFESAGDGVFDEGDGVGGLASEPGGEGDGFFEDFFFRGDAVDKAEFKGFFGPDAMSEQQEF